MGSKFRVHVVDADRNAINEREGLRAFGEDRSEHAWDNVSKFSVLRNSFSENLASSEFVLACNFRVADPGNFENAIVLIDHHART